MSSAAAAASSASSSKKRKYIDYTKRSGGNYGSNHNPKWQNSKRGAPGVLMTCETSREVKCQREGLEILNHYQPFDLLYLFVLRYNSNCCHLYRHRAADKIVNQFDY